MPPAPAQPAQNAEVAPIASQSVDLPISEHEPDGNHVHGSAPGSDRKRKYQDRWLKIWPWLFFEKSRMFCK